MSAPIVHINLLQRTAPAHTVAWSLAGLLVATVLGTLYYGNGLRQDGIEAQRQRDGVAQQVKSVQQQMAVKTGEQAKSAQAVALRKEIDTLQPQAQLSQSLLDAVRAGDASNAADFTRVLTAMTGLSEPGLWLTTLTVSGGGKQLELQGGAGDGASVLRYASRANQSLQPLAVRLDSLEVTPLGAAGATAAAPGAGGGSGSGGVSFKLR